MKLTEKLNSQYAEAKNNLNKRKGVFIDIFVENEDDIPFWKHQFSCFGIKTKIYPGSKTSLNRGKQEILKLQNQTGKYTLLCVDSDYDYILDGATQQSAAIKNNPFIFQTYTHSIENYKCYAPAFEQIIIDTTLNDNNQIFDCEAFMINFSKIIYPLFLYSFYYERKFLQENEKQDGAEQVFTLENFGAAIKLLKNVALNDQGKKDLAVLSKNVEQYLAKLPTINDNDLKDLQAELKILGVMNENTYLFIKGHILFDNVIKMFLVPLHKQMKREKVEALKLFENHKNSVNKYQNEVKNNNIDTVLNSHKYYVDCFLMRKIEADINNRLAVC